MDLLYWAAAIFVGAMGLLMLLCAVVFVGAIAVVAYLMVSGALRG
jgi:hypothetical protein